MRQLTWYQENVQNCAVCGLWALTVRLLLTVLVLHMTIHVHSMLVTLGNTALAMTVPIPRSGDPNFPQGINEADERRKIEKKEDLDADPWGKLPELGIKSTSCLSPHGHAALPTHTPAAVRRRKKEQFPWHQWEHSYTVSVKNMGLKNQAFIIIIIMAISMVHDP